MLKAFFKYLDNLFNMDMLKKIIALLLIILLLMLTNDVWGSWFHTACAIIQPFFIGFCLAYIIHPLIIYLEKKKISKNISIIAVWLVIIACIVLLGFQLLPLLYDKISSFISSLVNGIQWIGIKLSENDALKDMAFLNTILSNIVNGLQSFDKWVPSVVTTLPTFMSTFLNVLTNTLFSIIVAIYMLFDFDKIKKGIVKFSQLFFENSPKYLSQVDKDVSVYLRSLLILMMIKLVEYSLFYFLVGHKDWLIIGILSSIGLCIPYIGGTIANAFGILTALTLSPIRITILIIGILILSNVDAYMISPLVHEKRSSLGPLVTLLAVFAGGVLYGGIGIMASIPLAIAIRSIRRVFSEEIEKEKLSTLE